MALIVRFDPRALADLESIRDYLVARSPSGAERVRNHLMATIDRLTDFPLLGRATDEPQVRVLSLTLSLSCVLCRDEWRRCYPPRASRCTRAVRSVEGVKKRWACMWMRRG
jgi:hypothetical protein